MILSAFLLRQKVDDSNPLEVILITFNMRDILQERFYSLHGTRANDKIFSTN